MEAATETAEAKLLAFSRRVFDYGSAHGVDDVLGWIEAEVEFLRKRVKDLEKNRMLDIAAQVFAARAPQSKAGINADESEKEAIAAVRAADDLITAHRNMTTSRKTKEER